MTTNQTNKIDSLESLLKEKERLKQMCRTSEHLIEQHVNYIRNNYVEISVDQIIVPAIKRTFTLENILRFFNLGSLLKVISGTDGAGNKETIVNSLAGLFGKTGWLVAAKLGLSLIRKFMKK